MTNILALDLASNTGWAAVQDGAVYSGDFRVGFQGKPVGPFIYGYGLWLAEKIAVHRPDVVIFEAPFIGDKSSQDMARKLMGLATETDRVCYAVGVSRVREGNIPQVRKHFIGRGNGKRKEIKLAVMTACREIGWNPKSDDEADALALLHYAAHCLRVDLPGPMTALEHAADKAAQPTPSPMEV